MNDKQRVEWNRRYEAEAIRLGAHKGKIDWTAATYLRSVRMSPEDAANRVYGPK